jgi:hypothetical protein
MTVSAEEILDSADLLHPLRRLATGEPAAIAANVAALDVLKNSRRFQFPFIDSVSQSLCVSIPIQVTNLLKHP